MAYGELVVLDVVVVVVVVVVVIVVVVDSVVTFASHCEFFLMEIILNWRMMSVVAV